jgi:hypothetical protein
MTVLAPTPDRPRRAPLLRRAGFLAAAIGLIVAFGSTLSGIASTRGTVRPDGQAAAIAARQDRTAPARRHDCPHHRGRTRAASGSV